MNLKVLETMCNLGPDFHQELQYIPDIRTAYTALSKFVNNIFERSQGVQLSYT